MPMPRPIEWRSRDRHRPCVIQFCNKDASDRYDVPLCQEHILSIWIMVDQDMRAQNRTTGEVEREYDEREEAEYAARRAALPGIIYYLELGEYLKIGYTNNLERRIREYPPNANLLAHHEGTKEDELELHQRFAAFRDAGREWYRDVPEIREHIAEFHTDYLPRKKRRSDPTGPQLRGRTKKNSRSVVR